jgi:hypothetical protein
MKLLKQIVLIVVACTSCWHSGYTKSNPKKDFAQKYLDQFKKDQLYNIYAMVDDQKRLLCQVGERLHANGLMPTSKHDPRINEITEYRTLFKIQVNKKEGDGVLGIEAASHEHKLGNLLQRYEKKWRSGIFRTKQTEWTSRVRFENDNFQNFEQWYPRNADNGGIYLDHKSTKAWLNVTQETIDVEYSDQDESKTMVKRYTVEANDNKKTQFFIVPFKEQVKEQPAAAASEKIK